MSIDSFHVGDLVWHVLGQKLNKVSPNIGIYNFDGYLVKIHQYNWNSDVTWN